MSISRRGVLAGCAALTALAACARTGDPEIRLLSAEFTDGVAELEDRYTAKVGFYGRNLRTGRELAHNADDLFATGSTFKAYLAAEALRADQHGELSLADTVYVDPAAFVPSNSPITEPALGGRMTVRDLCAAAVRQSDNTATNLLLAALGGPQSVTGFARAVGDERTWMVRWEPDLNSALPGDPRDTTTPRAMSTGFTTMLTGGPLDESHRALLREWMTTIVTGDRLIRAGLPPGWTVADKTGGARYGTTNDLGVAEGPAGERLQLGVMTRTRTDDPDAPLMQPLVADVTRLALPGLLA